MESTAKIKILYIIDTITSISAGTERQLSQLITNLDRDRFEPELLCLQDAPYLGSEYFPCPQHTLNMKSVISWNGFMSLFKLRDFISANNYHIVQTIFPDSNVVGVLAAKMAGCQAIISTRRNTGFFYDSKKLLATKFANKHVHKFLANSNFVVEEICKVEDLSTDRFAVIYNGLDSKRLQIDPAAIDQAVKKMKLAQNQMLVGIVANLRPVKDLESFIRAAGILNQSNPDLKFVIIGAGSQAVKDMLMKLVQQLNLVDRVIFTGSLENPLPYVKCFTVGVLSSTSEGLSNTLMEYSALGIPAVATNVGGNPEVVTDKQNGLLVPAKNPEKLAEAVDILLRDENMRIHMSEQAVKLAGTKFNLMTGIKLHQSLYTKLFDEALGEAQKI